MSEQTQTTETPQPANIKYVIYDPARRRRKRTRWRAYDPALVAYEPARRRQRIRYDPAVGGSKAVTDAVVDGLGFGLLTHTVPIPAGSIGGFSYSDVAAGVLTFVYEKYYMRRGWTAAVLGAVTGIATGRLVSALGGWKQ